MGASPRIGFESYQDHYNIANLLSKELPLFRQGEFYLTKFKSFSILLTQIYFKRIHEIFLNSLSIPLKGLLFKGLC